MNECYKCQEPIDVPQEVVHPLCEECEADFQAWMSAQMFAFDGKEEDAI